MSYIESLKIILIIKLSIYSYPYHTVDWGLLMSVGKGSIENMWVYIHMYIYIINIYIYVCAYILYTYIYTYIFRERECSKILFANVVDNVKLIKLNTS